MRKLIVVAALVGALLTPTAAQAQHPLAEAQIGGTYGAPACYAQVDYFSVEVFLQSVPPFVGFSRTGSVGGGVHCPLLDP